MILKSDEPIVSDWVLIFGLIWGIVFVALMYAKIYSEKLLTKEHIFEIGFVVAVALLSIPYMQLISKGIYWGIDTNVQNMRIEGIKDGIIGGQFPVVIAPSMCNGYGSIEPMMYPSMFLYPYAFLRILRVSPVMVYKLAHIVTNLFMCSTCYVCVKRITRSIKASSIALVAFAFSYYHLSMIGTSDWTYGMGIAIIFMFVAIIGVYEIFVGNQSSRPYLTIGMWGIMNSHILSALFISFIVGVLFIVYFRKSVREKRIMCFFYAVAVSVPVCLYRIYTFMDAFLSNSLNTSVLNLHAYNTWVFSIKRFFTDPMSILAIGIVVISIICIIAVKKEFTDNIRFFITVLCMDVFCIILVSNVL